MPYPLTQRSLILFGCTVLLACGSPTAPLFPSGEKIPMPAEYRSWWADVEQCSGLSGSPNAVDFYLVDSLPHRAIGQWDKVGTKQRIYIVRFYAQSTTVVKHEIMHALLPVRGHPAEYFNGRCGDLMGVDS